MIICVICLVDLGDGEEIYVCDKMCRLFKCNYRFYIYCIIKWFKYGRYYCLYCRCVVYKIDEDNEIDGFI